MCECSKVRKFRCLLLSLVSRLFTLLVHTIVVWVVIHFEGGACFNVFFGCLVFFNILRNPGQCPEKCSESDKKGVKKVSREKMPAEKVFLKCSVHTAHNV